MNQKTGQQAGVTTQTGNKKVRNLSETVSNRHLDVSRGLVREGSEGQAFREGLAGVSGL